MANPDLAWALSELKPENDRQRRYTMYRSYYEGDHRLAFATRTYKTAFWEMFRQFADNLCSSVVDIQAERLEVIGFTTSAAETDDSGAVAVVADPMANAIWEVWEDGFLPIASDQIHHDAFCYGDAFGIVWDEGDGVCFYHQDPEAMAVRYSKARRNVIELAAKTWIDADRHRHICLYYPDRNIEYVSDQPEDDRQFAPLGFSSGTPVEATSYQEMETEQHNLGFVPVYHFANKKFGGYGISELRDVLPLQNALNKQICDMLVAMEFQAFRQRWVTGVEIELDEDGKPKEFPFDYGADRLLALPDSESRVGEFGQADLTPFYMAIRDSRAEVARVSGIPLHYFYVATSDSPSGEALKTSELRFSRKLRNRQRLFGKTWENAMLGLLSADDTLANDADGVQVPDGDFDINAVWAPEDAYSPSEKADYLLKKKALGVPQSQLQKELGYDYQQIEQFAEEKPTPPAVPTPVEQPDKSTSKTPAEY